MIDRRDLIATALAAGGTLLAGRAKAQLSAASDISEFPIWTGNPPGPMPTGLVEQEIPRSPTGPADDTAFLHVARPTLLHCRPVHPNGAAILLIPGGSYQRVAIGYGGRELLRKFAAKGYAAYLLKYRLPGDAWATGPNAPLQDAQRALRLIRARGATEGFDPDRIALWGGSAGGHLAARLANVAIGAYPASDRIDSLPLGVRAALLLYPVNLMSGPHVHAPSREALASHASSGIAIDSLAAEASVSSVTPPTFLSHALDDRVVPAENSLSYFAVLRRAGVPSELHVQELGGHGYAWSRVDGSDWGWPEQALEFLRRHGA